MKGIVLVVDADPVIREQLIFLLQEDGYLALEATDGEQALDILLRQQRPLVVALDDMMPYLNGQEVLTEVQANVALRHRHRFLYMTARSNQLPETLRTLLDEQQIPLMVKPLHAPLFLEMVHRLAQLL